MSEDKETKMKELAEKLRIKQDIEGVGTKPFFSYNRDVFHKEEPCYFCKTTKCEEVGGRYLYSAISPDEAEYVSPDEYQKQLIPFCGDCEETLDEYMECDME